MFSARSKRGDSSQETACDSRRALQLSSGGTLNDANQIVHRIVASHIAGSAGLDTCQHVVFDFRHAQGDHREVWRQAAYVTNGRTTLTRGDINDDHVGRPGRKVRREILGVAGGTDHDEPAPAPKHLRQGVAIEPNGGDNEYPSR